MPHVVRAALSKWLAYANSVASSTQGKEKGTATVRAQDERYTEPFFPTDL